MTPRLWTALVTWGPWLDEEIDVLACTRLEALRKVRAELAENYQPGGHVVRLVEAVHAVVVWSLP